MATSRMAARQRSAGRANNQNHPVDVGQISPKNGGSTLVTPRKTLELEQQTSEPAEQVRRRDRRAGRRRPPKSAEVPPLMKHHNDGDRRIVVVGEKATALPRTVGVTGHATTAVEVCNVARRALPYTAEGVAVRESTTCHAA